MLQLLSSLCQCELGKVYPHSMQTIECILTLMQTIDFIGTTLHSVTTKNDLIDQVMRNPQASVRTCLSFLGHMASGTLCYTICKTPCRLSDMVPDSVFTSQTQHEYCGNNFFQSSIVSNVVEGSSLSICGCPFWPPLPHKMIITDASLLDWGAHMDNHMAQGTWTPQDAHQSSGTPGRQGSLQVFFYNSSSLTMSS